MSAALTHLTLSHFRSHKLTRLSTAGRSVVLYGANGVGKTNVLEAVSVLSPGRGLRRVAAAEMGRTQEGVGWKVSAELSAPTGQHNLETWSENGGPRLVRIDGKTAPQVALGQLVSVVWLVPAMDRLWTEGADGRRRFLDRITLSFRTSHGQATLSYEKAMRERNRLLKDQVADAAWYNALELQMAAAGAEIMSARAQAVQQLARAQADAKTAFPRADLRLVGPDGSPDTPLDAEQLRDALGRSRPSDLRAGRTLTGPHRSDLEATYADKGIEASLASTGEQKALLISLVLANSRALAGGTRGTPILLLDEVAAHLDADRRAALFGEIKALGAQAWMTGTGPELFEAVGDEAAKIHLIEGANGSQVAAG